MPKDQPIPDALHQRLQSLREQLIHDGSVIQRCEKDRKPTWRLRVRVKESDGSQSKQLAIPLDNETVANAVKNLIQSWREAAQTQEEEPETFQCQLKLLIEILPGCSRRRLRYARNTYNEAKKRGDMALWIMNMEETYIPPVKPVGRPRGRRLRDIASSLMPVGPLTPVESNGNISPSASIRGTKAPVFDRGFDIKVPSRSERPKRKPQFQGPDGRKDLDWRFRAALKSVNLGCALPVQDRWARMTVNYLAGYLKKRTFPPGVFRPLAAAHKLYLAASPTTHRLEALLLTEESDITIAAVLHMSRHTIRAYRKVFHDIDAVPKAILLIEGSVMRGPLDQYGRWRHAARTGGLEALLALWAYESKMEISDPVAPT